MVRRSVRTPDPDLSLASVLREQVDLPPVVRAAELFGREAPLELEVGSGKGLFLASASSARPHHLFLGVEISAKYSRVCAARLLKHACSNSLVVHGDAVKLLAEKVEPATLAAVHVYFPDPWWKQRHRKRRVMNEVLLRSVERALLPGGSLHFWTDVEEYFRVTLALIAQVTTLAGPFDVPEPQPESDFDYRTHFERRMRLNGLPVFRAEFRRTEAAAAPASPQG